MEKNIIALTISLDEVTELTDLTTNDGQIICKTKDYMYTGKGFIKDAVINYKQLFTKVSRPGK